MIQSEIKQTVKTGADNKDLVVGLDFGAAFTKVVIGDNRVRYAVPFADFSHPDNPYLLPSILNIDEKNICALNVETQTTNSDTEGNLKIPLLDGTCTEHDLVRVSAYLALVFREARNWLLRRYEKRYSRYDLSWSVNAGLPIEDSANNELSATYNKIIHTAWVISVLPGTVSLNRVRQYLGAADSAFDAFPALYRSKIINKSSIHTFPACCAQICGYVHSSGSSENLHMLIDVGAATVNIASFTINSSVNTENDSVVHANTQAINQANNQRCRLLACAFEAIGVSYLLKRRYENLKLDDAEINLFADIPDTHTFSQAHDLTDKDIKFADTLYSGDVGKLINTVLDTTKNRFFQDSDFMASGVPTFIYGGGAHLEIIQDIIDSHENAQLPHKIKSVCLSAPDDLMVEALPEGSYDRLSMAYGLSFTADEIAGTAVAPDSEEVAEVF